MARLTAVIAAWLIVPMATAAERYPVKPIHVIVTTVPGGLLDVAARVMSDYFERNGLGHFVVENRGGGGGVVGSDAIAKSPGDGYTLGVVQLGDVAITPFVLRSVPFDPRTDLLPVSTLTSSPVLVGINGALAPNTLAEFITFARGSEAGLNYGTAGPGSIPHLAGEMFGRLARVRLTPVHYRGAGPALTDLIAGHLQLMFVGYGALRPGLASGALKVLAVSQATRLAAAPQVPTAREAGLPGFDVNTWFGVVAPRGTPAAAIAQINAGIRAMLDDAAVRKRLIDAGLEPHYESPQDFSARIGRDQARYQPMIEQLGLARSE